MSGIKSSAEEAGAGGSINGSINSSKSQNGTANQFHIAICGVGMRLSGGIRSTEEFWDLLAGDAEARGSAPGAQNEGRDVHGSRLSEGHNSVDASLFTTTEGPADFGPYGQKLLEVTRECLEDACEVSYRGKDAPVACYLAMPSNEESESNNVRHTSIADYVSKQYDFQGPSVMIENADPSASLLALHEACIAIKNSDAKAALVAGINLMTAADADEDNAEREAVVAVFIKPMNDAIRDGNPIQAVICATNTCDGHEFQEAVNSGESIYADMIREAYDAAGLDPRDTAVIECYDAGFAGNQVELSALERVFGESDASLCSSCHAIGDSKSASGLISLIKAMISIKHQTILPSIPAAANGQSQNRKLSAFAKPREFPSGRAERISISYLGTANSGAHVILESYRNNDSSAKKNRSRTELVLFSASNATSLNQQIQLHHDFVKAYPQLVPDVAFTRALRREAFNHRAFSLLGVDGECLSTANPAKCPAEPPSITMVFSGQGAQWAGMGKELFQLDGFRDDIKNMDNILRQLKTPPSWTIEEEIQRSSTDPLCRIHSVETACTLSTALQIALFHQFERIGATPEAVVGHSSGEIAAAYATGFLTLKGAIVTAYYYGYAAAMSTFDGTMAVTGLSAEDTKEFLREGVVVACENSPMSTTISGDRDVMEEVMTLIKMSRPQVTTRKLHVGTAFHSHHMESISFELLGLLEAERIALPEQRTRKAILVSSVNSSILNAAKDLGPKYWVNNLISPVRFSSAVLSLLETTPQHNLFLEIGPHSTLSGPLSQICSANSVPCNYISSQFREKDCLASFLSAIGRLWQYSVALKYDPLFTGKAISGLPQYPWNYSNHDDSGLLDTNEVPFPAKDRRTQIITRATLMTTASLPAEETPKTELELILRALWADVLRNVLQIRIQDIRRRHNFFFLGGDSLTMTELATTAYRHGISLSPIDIMENPELAQMAAVASIDDAEQLGYAKPFSLIPQDSMDEIKTEMQKQCNLDVGTIEDIYPCTTLQEGFMALGLKQPGSYIHRQVYKLMPHVDIDHFMASWDAVIRLCGSLRSRIALVNSEALQAIVTTDTTWEAPVSNTDVNTYLNETRSVPMSYGDRLSRNTLLHQENGDTYFIWIVHHAVFDGLSMKIVLDALQRSYLSTNYSIEALPPYSNFIRYVGSLDYDHSREYWRKELEGAQRSQFPAASITAKSQDCVMKKSIPFQNPKAAITTATILRATWALLLAQYCGNDDVCFGMTLSGRQAPVPGLNEIPGPMIATVPVRIQIDREMRVSEFLQHIQSHASKMVAHEQFGLQNISKLGQSAREACDFANLLVIQPMQHLSSAAYSSSDSILQQGIEEKAISEEAMRNYFNYPLVLQTRVGDDAIELEFTYYNDVLTEGQLEALCYHFEHVTQQLLEQDDVPLKSITVSGPWDLQRALGCNSEEPDIISSCLHQIIEDHALKRPDAMAVHASDLTLTYSQLNLAADRLSSYLVDNCAVQARDLIHVCFEKSAWFFVSILAINKAGAAWVPLDPSHPLQRHKKVVMQTKAKLALASPTNTTLCADLVENVVEVSATLDEMLIKRRQGNKNPRTVSPSDACYVLFTSGSTGTPKGFVMQHRALCTSQTAATKRLRMTSDVKVLQFASYVFDMSIGETVGPWIAGACICVPSEEVRMNGLAEYIRTMKINWVYSTPSFSRTLNPDDIPDVELLLLAGEAVSRDILETWVGKVRLINGWGPAETCVFSTLHEYGSLDDSPLTIGRPVGGFCWLVDPENPHRLAPFGTVGEVVIQGPTLLREYLADPAKTESTTVKPLPSWVPNSNLDHWNRFYKSGDLCKYNPDGTIAFVTRKDTQIKIRGLRVELGEVEHQIKACLDGVQQLMVDKIDTEAGSSLIAFFCFSTETRMVPTADTAADGDAAMFLPVTSQLKSQIVGLIGHLSVNLPRYMIPSLFVPCRYMPSITSTKLDRRTLKHHFEKLDSESLSTYSLVDTVKNPPETATESKLQAIWAKRLNMPLESIGRDDSFLQIGGDSIAVIHFVADARQAGISLTVKDVFDDPRLWKVAAAADKTNGESNMISRVEPFDLVKQYQTDLAMRAELLTQCGLASWDLVEDAFPCTKLQEGLMALTAKQPGAYVAKMVFKVARNADIDHLKASWDHTVALCSNLRTRIVQLSSMVSLQVIVKEPVQWESTDNQNMDDFLRSASNIHMSHGSPLSRLALVNDDNGDRYFAFITHHSVFDGWSLALVIKTFHSIYFNTAVPPLGSYSSFVQYTLQLDLTSSEKYWKTQLSGARRALFPLPRDDFIITNSERKMGICAREITVPKSTNGAITTATYLRAAWAILLARYCSIDDVCFGASVSGRNAPLAGVENVLGLVVATLPIRIRLNPDQLLSEFLGDVQRQSTEMVMHEQFGLQNIAKLSSDAKDACSFTSLMVVQPKEITGGLDADEAILVSTRAEQRLAWRSMEDYYNYPLNLQCHLGHDSIELEFVYDANVISESQVIALTHQLDHITQQLVSLGREKLLRDVAIAGPWDFQQSMKWNDHEVMIEEHCMHDIISKQAKSCPNDEALYSSEGSLSYAALERLSDLVAYQLLQYNVQPETIVPFCMEKSIWAVIAMIGILKAGGAFMPLDPSHPESRRLALIQEVNAKVIITSPSTAPSCEGMAQHTIQVSSSLLTQAPKTTKSYRELSSYKKPEPHNAAYVLYTSGSTGKPKGLVMPHDAICTSLLRHPEKFSMNKSTRVFQFAAYVFDVCILDIFGSLFLGATVCVPTETERVGNASRFMTEARATWTMLTPSFVRTLDPDTLPTLQTLCLGGEASTRDILSKWHGRVEIINAYGPAEACVDVAGHVFKSRDDSPTNIGRPFAHTLWIVEPGNHNRLAPIGCIGELVIEGHAIARGYINNEEKTKESFIDDLEWLPSVISSGRPRVYKSGDLARFNPDGTIEFFGRRDTQVKIRGQRLELGEIEYNIKAKLANVQHTVVDLIEREAGKMIIAFITFKNHLCNTITDIADPYGNFIKDEKLISAFQDLILELRRVLPSYMIPSIIFPLRELPYTASNKIDRRTLRELATNMPREMLSEFSIAGQDKVSPTTEMEFKLQSLWARVLNINAEEISKFDSFLEIGGDSISAIYLSNLAAKENIRLPISSIFRDSQLASMAASMIIGHELTTDVQPFSMIEETRGESLTTAIRRQCQLSREQDLEDLYPCTPLQEGLMALTATRPGSYIAKRVYKLVETIDLDRFKKSWEQTIRSCSNLRTRIVLDGDAPLQAVVSDDTCWDQTDAQNLDAYMDEIENIDMTYGSRLSRHAIISTSNGPTYFVWVAHHAIFDAWTMQINMDVLQRSYAQDSLPTLRPFANFVQYVSQLDQDAAMDYWTEELEGAQRASFPPPKLVTESETAAQGIQIMKRKIAVPSQTNSFITMASVLRGAWALILSLYSETDDICFGTTMSGRQAPVQDLIDMAGPTIATVPVRVRLDRTQRVSEYLQNLQTQATEMVAYEQFGLQNISKLSASAKDATDFTSLFVVQSSQRQHAESHDGKLFTSDSNDETRIEAWLESFFNYPLTVECDLIDNHAILTLYYDGDILSDHQLQGLCNQFEQIIEQLNSQYEEPLNTLSMTSQWDIDFARAANPNAPNVVDTCIHTLIEERTKISPDSAAVCSWDADFTYSELDENANRLAHHLMNVLKVKIGDLVMVCFDKSAWYIVAILAINKIGAAWVPIDPSHPTERHQSIVKQTRSTLALCTPSNSLKCSRLVAEVVEVNAEFISKLRGSETYASKPDVKVSPDDVSYIIFTSGSTGVPKGVVIQHRAICSSQVSLSQRLGMHDGVRMLQFSSFVFDASVFEILCPLVSGACVCIPSWDMQLNTLAAFIRDTNVTWAILTPSLANVISPQDVPCLEFLALGGEAPSKEVFNTWFGKVRLFNAWGPTEAAIIAAIQEVQSTDLSHLTIGRPICGNCWIVDPEDPTKLAPVGAVEPETWPFTTLTVL
ncbi:AMP-binding enzyme domain-containing protein [Trichoderma breve]|uniref:AMP-binding enzyme domain-containing protein n=1 Tax=Trichoderma breve TaxID=2034170 RepID=A0A9W9E894_9HYPO|nr:AMP-binding enzyme domain-containing protein [Trichoderma breve]KAJ4861724.1 AMP-binding enzyme domain-containing protein [Trichoderma breve]